ncbi:MAG: SDR family oxidoreductase [Methanomassiliicoccales archaeon]|nr:SDR family oxidoreductase [Methanomassiliicoccales archaeon]
MTCVLVTGGAGFIGSHLCDRLLEDGYDVICVDNLLTGRKENIRHLIGRERFELLQHDILEPFEVNAEIIINLASPASPVHYQADPVKTLKINTIGIFNLMEMAKKHKAMVLQASTSEVYGDPLVHPQKEDYWGNVNPIGPRSCYDEGKRVAESILFTYHEKEGIEIKIARIFNTYGPRMAQNDGRVVSNFIVQALKGDDLTIYGDGSQTRSFCYISDLIEGLIRLMKKENFTGPVNLGNPEEISVIDLAKKIIELTESSSKITFKPLPRDDPARRRPDITLAMKMLGWKPTVDLETGLKKTIAYFKKHL